MSYKPIVLNNFSGGWATDKKLGIEHSFAYSQAVDFRKSPSQITPLPRTVREDNVVNDLVQNAVMDNTGDIYAIGSKGSFYLRSSGVWSVIGALPAGAFGLLYRQDQDSIYIAGEKTVSLYNPLSTTPQLQPNFYNTSKSTYNNPDSPFNVNSDQETGTLTTAILTSYMEGNENQLRYFQTDIEPLNSIGLFIVNKGTGNWTATIHDGLNNLIGTVTVVNANLNNNSWNLFTFTDQVRLQVSPSAQTYHIHVTSTVADGTVQSTENNNLSTCNLQIWADRLVIPNNGMHPMAQFQQFICIGNEHYLSVYEPLGEASPSNASWQRHKLTFPPGYEVCGLAVFNEYLAIACEKTTTGTQTPQDGIIFFWDGLSSTYNYFTAVPEGSPYAIHQYRNVLYYYAGGAWYAIPAVTAQPEKLRTMPFGENSLNNNNDSTIIYPYAATTRNGIQLMAYPSVSTNPNIEFGVYSWGQVDKNFPNSFGYSYVISTGSKTYSEQNNLSIGMVQNFGDDLLISWRDDQNGGYGVDIVNSESKPAAYSTLESLIYDFGWTGKQKNTNYVEGTWLPLPDGVSLRLKYSIDRGEWIYSEYYTNADLWEELVNYARQTTFGDNNTSGRFTEFQFGIEIYCDDTVTETPVITSIADVIDNLAQESPQ